LPARRRGDGGECLVISMPTVPARPLLCRRPDPNEENRMLTRIKHTAIALTTALALLGGCATDDPEGIDLAPDEVGQTTSAIIDHGGITTLPDTVLVPDDNEPPLLPNPPDDPEPSAPPAVPGVPRWWPRLHTLHVPVATLQDVIPFLMSGTRISLDVTHNAPPIYDGPPQVCHRDQAGFDAMRAECMQLPTPVERQRCLRQAAQAFPLTCTPAPQPHYSYVAFTDTLKNLYPNLTDKLFDFEPIHRHTWSGWITIRLNQLHSTLGIGNLDILAGNRGGLPYVGLGANVQSGQPTAYCDHDVAVLGCPDIELTNMHLVVRFEDLKPDPLDTSRITYSAVTAPFSFNRNLNNIPDFLVTIFYDVDARIKARTEQKIQSTFLEDARHVEMAKLLTNALAWYAERNDPMFTGFKRISRVAYYQGEIIVYYVDNSDPVLDDLPVLTAN
jgi:hypothetical protein